MSEEILSAELQAVIWNLVTLSEEVNDKGTILPITSYHKKHLRGCNEVKEKLLKNVSVIIQKNGVDVVESFGYELKEGEKEINSVFKDGPVNFEKKAIDAIKFYFEKREEVPTCSSKTFDELERLIA